MGSEGEPLPMMKSDCKEQGRRLAIGGRGAQSQHKRRVDARKASGELRTGWEGAAGAHVVLWVESCAVGPVGETRRVGRIARDQLLLAPRD
eukprot:3944170-Pleurochrysis_carterae.AAC.1